jgi:hypothetical protein
LTIEEVNSVNEQVLFEWCGIVVTQKSHDETASEEQAKRKEEEEERKTQKCVSIIYSVNECDS